MATRVLMIKADGSVLVHSDGGSYKPLNWMSPPCKVTEGVTEDGQVEWLVTSRASGKGPADTLRILLEEIHSDSERSEEHTSELQSLMRISYADFGLKNKNRTEHTKR